MFKQPDLDQRLQYDDHLRKSLVDLFYDNDATLESVAAGTAPQRGDFLGGAYEARIRRNPDRIQVQLLRDGNVNGIPVRITKGLTLDAGSSTLQVAYLLENLPQGRPLHFAVEFNFAGMPANAYGRNFSDIDGNLLGQLGSKLDLQSVFGLGLTDEWLGIDVGLKMSRPTDFWTFPIETVSQSEGGFELVHQSVVVMPHWLVEADKEGRWSVTMQMSLDTSRAEAATTTKKPSRRRCNRQGVVPFRKTRDNGAPPSSFRQAGGPVGYASTRQRIAMQRIAGSRAERRTRSVQAVRYHAECGNERKAAFGKSIEDAYLKHIPTRRNVHSGNARATMKGKPRRGAYRNRRRIIAHCYTYAVFAVRENKTPPRLVRVVNQAERLSCHSAALPFDPILLVEVVKEAGRLTWRHVPPDRPHIILAERSHIERIGPYPHLSQALRQVFWNAIAISCGRWWNWCATRCGCGRASRKASNILCPFFSAIFSKRSRAGQAGEDRRSVSLRRDQETR